MDALQHMSPEALCRCIEWQGSLFAVDQGQMVAIQVCFLRTSDSNAFIESGLGDRSRLDFQLLPMAMMPMMGTSPNFMIVHTRDEGSRQSLETLKTTMLSKSQFGLHHMAGRSLFILPFLGRVIALLL